MEQVHYTDGTEEAREDGGITGYAILHDIRRLMTCSRKLGGGDAVSPGREQRPHVANNQCLDTGRAGLDEGVGPEASVEGMADYTGTGKRENEIVAGHPLLVA